MDRSVIENLLATGFVETRYKGQEGVFYTKQMKASDVPYLAQKVVDDDLLFCVCPDGEVQLVYGDQFEKAPMLSAEGRALLVDSGYPDYGLHASTAGSEQNSAFDAFGQPVPAQRKQAGYDFCKTLGLESDQAWGVVNAVALAIEEDKPFIAQQKACERFDLTGAYRLVAILCTAKEAA